METGLCAPAVSTRDGKRVCLSIRAIPPNQTVGFLQALGERNGDVPGAIRGLAGKPPATVALQQRTRRIPIVFVGVTDPAATSRAARLSAGPCTTLRTISCDTACAAYQSWFRNRKQRFCGVAAPDHP